MTHSTTRYIPITSCKSCPHCLGRISCTLANRNFDAGWSTKQPPPDWCPLDAIQSPAQVQASVSDKWIDAVMEQAKVFASAWSLVGSRFDDGSMIDEAEQAKAELRTMLSQLPSQPTHKPLTDSELTAEWDNCFYIENPNDTGGLMFADTVMRACAKAWGVDLGQEGNAA